MLQLVMGRSGSGKTHAVIGELVTRAKAGEQGLLLVVPEQFSFESERTLLRLLGPAAGAVRVLSFTRMADAVSRECGGFSGRLMDDVTRTLLMSRALAEVQDQLTLYRRHAVRADYVRAVLDVVTECKLYAVTPRQFEDVAAVLPQGTLRTKLQELSSIMEAYGALVAESYVDPADALSRLADQLPDSTLGRDASIFVDGFKGFTEQEMQVMTQLMRRAACLTVTLCTDSMDDHDEYALFAPVSKTARRFVQVARDNGVKVASPRYLTGNHRVAPGSALETLELGCFSADALPFEGEAPGVTVAPCTDRYAECRALVREVRRLLREEGWRCRDIAVTARNLPDYAGILDTAFRAAGIPFYMDRREDVRTEPLIALAEGAVTCAAGNWQRETVLRLAKTGLLGFSAHSTALLENYIYMWKLGGSRLRSEWTANPDGLSAKADETTLHRLTYLNLLRRRLIDPLDRLAQALSGAVTGGEFAHALFRYLEEARVPRMVRLQVRRLQAAGDVTAAERLGRTWELLMDLLDRFGTALRTTVLSAERFGELFSLAVSVLDVGSIPQGLDAVQIGSAERMRFSAPRAVWILGANEGVFPAYPATGGLFSDRERRELAKAGLSLSGTGDQQAVEERLYAYFALSAASERLYVSWLRGTGEETVPPSALAEAVCTLVPGHRTLQGDEMPESVDDAFDRLARCFGTPGGEQAALRAHFAADPAYAGRLAAMERAATGEPIAFNSSAAAAAFFGDHMTVSASQVEKYHNCRFAYFCQYGLNVKERRPAELDSLEFGLLAHHVAQVMLPRYAAAGFAKITRAQVRADTAQAVTAYIEEEMGGTADKSERFLALAARLGRTVESLMWHLVQEFRQSRFVPTDYELPVGEKDGLASTVLSLPDGSTVRVNGKIDRVDVYHTGGKAYVRVVDYKTGDKKLKLSEVVDGLNLQMLIYLFSIWDNGAARYGAEVAPAGVLYLPACLPVVEISPADDEAARERRRTAALCMNGLVLDDPEIINAMEADASKLFIPVKLRADGLPDGRSSVASLAQFGRLKNHVERLLRDMAATLREGDVAAAPLHNGKEAIGCRYCPYQAVCGYEDGAPVRRTFLGDAEEIWGELSQEK